MQFILTALKAESLPLIDHFNLIRDRTFSFPVFGNDDMMVVGIGVGEAKIQNRLEIIHSYYRQEIVQFINIGIAGGNPNSTSIGESYFIQKINHKKTGKTYYPDILIRHPFEEESIITVQNVVKDHVDNYPGLVDMESAEIFRVALRLVKSHRLAFIKIVSDHMDHHSLNLSRNDISTIVESHIPKIEAFMLDFKRLKLIDESILNTEDKIWINNLYSTFNLTETQKYKITHLSKGFRLRCPDGALPEIILSTKNTIKDRNQNFHEICDKLSA